MTLRQLMLAALAAAVLGLALCGAGLFLDYRVTVAAWLTAAVTFLSFPLGALTILMIHTLTGGRWGEAAREPLRAMLVTLPLGLLLLVPFFADLDSAFPWAIGDTSTLPESVRHKLAYLNVPFFAVRFVICSAVWLVLAWLVLGWAGDRPGLRAVRGSALGLVVHALAVSVFSIDWMMSLEPEFYSTIYALLEASAQAVGAFALAAVALAVAEPVDRRRGGGDTALSEDLANMLFGFVLVWVYLAFMQWLIVWAADLPVEIRWYLNRTRHGYQYVLWLLVMLHFAVPFAAFLNRDLKRSRTAVVALAAVVVVAHVIDVFWRVRPPLLPEGPVLHWFDAAALLGAGGLWVALFAYRLDRTSPPERVEEGGAHG